MIQQLKAALMDCSHRNGGSVSGRVVLMKDHSSGELAGAFGFDSGSQLAYDCLIVASDRVAFWWEINKNYTLCVLEHRAHGNHLPADGTTFAFLGYVMSSFSIGSTAFCIQVESGEPSIHLGLQIERESPLDQSQRAPMSRATFAVLFACDHESEGEGPNVLRPHAELVVKNLQDAVF